MRRPRHRGGSHAGCGRVAEEWLVLRSSIGTGICGRLGRRRRLGRVDELLNFCSFLVDFGQMLCVLLLVNLEFCLGAILLADMNIVLSEAVMGVWKVGIHFERLRIFRNGFRILMVIDVEITQLHVRFSKLRIESHRLLQRGSAGFTSAAVSRALTASSYVPRE